MRRTFAQAFIGPGARLRDTLRRAAGSPLVRQPYHLRGLWPSRMRRTRAEPLRCPCCHDAHQGLLIEYAFYRTIALSDPSSIERSYDTLLSQGYDIFPRHIEQMFEV
jgi:hypothetical protein